MSKTEKRKFRELFRNYQKLSRPMVKALEAYGLTIAENGKHYKIQRADGIGGCVILSKSPSDFRTGLNSSTHLIKLIEAT